MGVEPSMKMASTTAPKASADADQGCDVHQSASGATVRRGWVAQAGHGCERGAFVSVSHIDRLGHDGGAVLDHEVGDGLDVLGHEVLGAVDEGDDRVGRGLDPLDEVRVHRKTLAVEARQDNHGFTIPGRSFAARP